MLQVLWEHGFIDPQKGWHDYTIDGKKDVHGNIIKTTSIKHLMSLQFDFAHETTLLQTMGERMGVMIRPDSQMSLRNGGRRRRVLLGIHQEHVSTPTNEE